MKRLGIRWIVGTLVIGLVVFGTIQMGLWQLERLDGRKAANESIAASLAAEPLVLDEPVIPDEVGPYTRVSVAGRWEPSMRVLLRYPIRNGQQGYEVLEPLRVGDGLILVNRGWVTQDAGRAMQLAPEGTVPDEVVVEGLVRDSEATTAEIGTNGAQPPVPTIARVDIARIQQLMGGDLLGNETLASKWVQLTSPAGEGDPLPVEAPELSEGSHFSYALQWFAFGAIALIGWIALLAHTFLPEGLFGRRAEDHMFDDLPPEAIPGYRPADHKDD